MKPARSVPAAGSEAARRPTVVSRAWLALALALAILHLFGPLASLPRLVALNYNEGWNAYHAESVRSERPLYPAPESLFPNNYPPLSFAIVAAASGVLGDPVRAGRVVSLFAFLVVLVELGWIAGRISGSRRLGILAGLLVAAWMGAAFPDYVGMNDPQLLAHALMLGGLALLVGGRSPARLGGAAVLMALGGLVKHNLIALPLAVTLWLYLSDRRALRVWLAVSAGALAVGLAALFWAHGTAVFESVLRPRTASLVIAARTSAEWLRSLAAPLAIGVLAASEVWRDRDDRSVLLYAGLGLVVGFLFAAGEGVSVNTYFDLLFALGLLGPLLLARVDALLPKTTRVIPIGALTLGLLLDPLLQAPASLLGLPERVAQLEGWEAGTRQDVAYLASKGESVVCENLALCFWAGKPAGVDLFNSQQLFRAGAVSEDALLGRVERGEFAVVQLTGLPGDRDDERVSGQLNRALQLHYVVDRVSTNGVFLRPRRGRASGAR